MPHLAMSPIVLSIARKPVASMALIPRISRMMSRHYLGTRAKRRRDLRADITNKGYILQPSGQSCLRNLLCPDEEIPGASLLLLYT